MKRKLFKTLWSVLIIATLLGNSMLSYAAEPDVEKPSVLGSSFTATGEEILDSFQSLLKSEILFDDIPEAAKETTIAKLPDSNTWNINSEKDNCFGTLIFGDMEEPQDISEIPKGLVMFLMLGDGTEEDLSIIDTYLEAFLYLCSYDNDIDGAKTLLNELKSEMGEIIFQNGMKYMLKINPNNQGFIIIYPVV